MNSPRLSIQLYTIYTFYMANETTNYQLPTYR